MTGPIVVELTESEAVAVAQALQQVVADERQEGGYRDICRFVRERLARNLRERVGEVPQTNLLGAASISGVQQVPRITTIA